MTDAIEALPMPDTRKGEPRRVGVEVECGGLTEGALAQRIAGALGGQPRQTADYEWVVEGTELGDFEVLLDTALRDHVTSQIGRAGLDLGRSVIPVEYVTPPILPGDIARLDALNRDLAEAGAFGTRDGIALGFGVHLNVALPGTGVEDILPVLRAFALAEDWLRARMEIDASRRLLPFVDPYPHALVDALCDAAADQWGLAELIDAYLAHAPSRNHALDALPILKHLDAARVVDAVPAMADKSARPAWHYRLPDCRIDEPRWSISLEWNRWCAIERIAADADLSGRLREAWREHRAEMLHLPGRWRAVSGQILDQAGVAP